MNVATTRDKRREMRRALRPSNGRQLLLWSLLLAVTGLGTFAVLFLVRPIFWVFIPLAASLLVNVGQRREAKKARAEVAEKRKAYR